MVISLSKDIQSVPFLVEFLTNVDINFSKMAYNALINITGLDPVRKNNEIKINSPEVIEAFTEYYKSH